MGNRKGTMVLFIIRNKTPSLSFLSSPKTSLDNLPRHFSTLSPPQPSSSNFMAEYLITSFGFSPERAARASKRISHITSPSKPDSVRHFLKHHGFTDPQIATLIANYPPVLCGDTNRTMEPNLRALRDMGFSDPDLRLLVAHNPQALKIPSLVPRLQFWRAFFDGDMRRLVLVLTRNRGLITQDVHTAIAAKIALLEEYGLPQSGIRTVVLRTNSLFRMSTASIRSVLKRVEEFGFHRGSPMFAIAFVSFCGIGRCTLKARMELFKSFGWTDGELLSAIQKFPFIIRLSEENILAKMTFLVERAGFTQRYIALRPCMLSFSLEKKLIPRFHVMQILESNRLLGTKWGFYSIMAFTEKNFLDRIVLPYKDKLSSLLETYTAACAGKFHFRYLSCRQDVETDFRSSRVLA